MVVYSVEMSKYIFNFFLLSDTKHLSSFFLYETLRKYSDGDTLTGAYIAIFNQYMTLTSMTVVLLSVVNISTVELGNST